MIRHVQGNPLQTRWFKGTSLQPGYTSCIRKYGCGVLCVSPGASLLPICGVKVAAGVPKCAVAVEEEPAHLQGVLSVGRAVVCCDCGTRFAAPTCWLPV